MKTVGMSVFSRFAVVVVPVVFGLGPSTVSPKTGWPSKVTLGPSSLIGIGAMKLACF